MKRRHFLAASAALPFARSAMASQPLHVRPEDGPHEATFMMWPASRAVHPERAFLDILQSTIADIANTIAAFEPVILLAAPSDQARAKQMLSAKVTLWDIPTDDLWARDAGPLVAHRGSSRVVSHIKFNGWGNKQVHTHDGALAGAIANRLGFDLLDSGLFGEAGGVEHDGHGLLMAHESSWVNENRNPGLSCAEVERRLLKAFGAERMIWAQGVRGEDITDYHIDSLARFTGPNRVLINLSDNPDWEDPFHVAAYETYDNLKAAGVDLEVIPEPSYRRVKDVEFVASYANYYACNGAVIAAQFGDAETDEIAREALVRHYPGREIVTLNVDALGEVGGGIHCATQQLPSA
ncbi:agmatine deiminase family protein [Planktotalea arctica]|uniref:agmatine deiminase family protein n=1 Tax=Planktotalea arctica TaxID=1481893 RepID=UPI000A16F1C8|nr:agmatine deiminase family protein [Planktotalea arctica]